MGGAETGRTSSKEPQRSSTPKSGEHTLTREEQTHYYFMWRRINCMSLIYRNDYTRMNNIDAGYCLDNISTGRK